MRLAEELKRNEKERAEHVMLVDLGRNDVGRVSAYGIGARADLHGARALLARHAPGVDRRGQARRSARPARCAGRLFPGRAPSRARRRCGRWRSSPSSRTDRRGVYAGAVGYLDFAGNLDFCITIRTVVIENGTRLRAGRRRASSPTRIRTAEYEETRDKARAVIRALELAQAGTVAAASMHGSRHRQLRFVHLQPRAVPRRARRRRSACGATTR